MTDLARYPIIPWPRSLEPRDGAFAPRSPLVIAFGGTGPTVAGDDRVSLAVRADAPAGAEAYALDVTPDRIEIAARDRRGLVYGAQTLRQLASASPGAIPAVRIDDAPRFRWRGLHLDVSRHFFPLEFIKTYIDALAAFKLNTFHWHLTDDQGWRLEIKRYPKLTEVGGWRRETVGDGKPHGGFYTQEEIREIVAYAAERHITVVPEI
ncbi:MAG TPA: family 20 glycosylhydrolase, partial [Candidatus Limnocylindria bacterium]|nr:family 20 glycosylhydrolase [Candidatus Limnocylindria bacterium]